MQAQDHSSTRPYLLRALHEWCTDNGFTPYIVVRVDETVQVPRDYVHNGEIVLNVSHDATSALQLGNDYVEFKARFGGRPHAIMIPVARVMAIYARENGQGMAFAPEEDVLLQEPASVDSQDAAPSAPQADEPRAPVVVLQPVPSSGDEKGDEPPPPAPAAGARPTLTRIK